MAEFDFKELVARAHFDYVGPAFPEWWENNKTAVVLPNLKKIFGGGLLGKKYFLSLTLKDSNGETYTLPNEPLISLDLVKTIVETPTVGKYRKGTVKEYINTEDYQITIRGVCINTENKKEYPAQEVAELNKLFEKNEALEVVSNPFFELFGIRKIVLTDIHFDEMIGQSYLQKYVLNAISDQDFYADLKEVNISKSSFLYG